MQNLETLIASMECCIREGDCQGCAYECWIDHSCISNLLHDALDVIKPEEPIEPIIAGDGKTFELAKTWWYSCGSCGEAIDLKDKYCRHCGKAVKWE